MRVFVTGVAGQLGHDVMNELQKRGIEGIGTDLKETYSGVQDGTAVTAMPYVSLDITDRDAVMAKVTELHPDVIIHCAAWTAVDLAEDEDKKPKVRAINVDGTKNLADAAKAVDAKMVYISTDYVFDGQGTTPWEPDCKDYKPLNVYGETKLGGELAVSSTLTKYFIVRIAWVFGVNGKNFIRTMLNVGKTHDTVRVVNDQIGTPTYTLDLVGEADAELGAVSQKGLKSWRVCRGGDDQDVLDPRQHQGGQGIVDHRLVIHREELLARHHGEGIEARSRASCQYDTLHESSPSSRSVSRNLASASFQSGRGVKPFSTSFLLSRREL